MSNLELKIYKSVIDNDKCLQCELLEKINEDKRIAREVLILAIKSKHSQVVDILLNNDLDVNKKDEDGWLPIHHAADIGDEDIFKMILSKTKKPSRGAGFNKNTPAHIAVKNGFVSIINTMIQNKIDIIQNNALSQSPLHLAVKNTQYDLIKILLDAGCDPNQPDKSGKTPIDLAMEEVVSCEDSLKFSENNLNNCNLKKNILNVLIKNNKISNSSNINQENNLIISTKNHQTDIVKTMIENGLSPNIVDKDGWTPLHHAANLGFDDLVSIFLDASVDVNKLTKIERANALHFSAYAGHQKIVELLLPHIKDVNVKNHDFKTALHLSVEENHIDIALKLIKAGADIHIENSNGENIQVIAEQRKQSDLLCALFCDGSAYFMNVFKKIENKQFDQFKKLIESGYNVNRRNVESQTFLTHACIHNAIEIVIFLIEKGCLINEIDSKGMTALHYAVKNGFEDIVEVLVNHGADVNIKDHENHTPIFNSLTAKTVQILVNKNAALDIIDKYSFNVLTEAVYSNRPEVAMKLLEFDAPLLNEESLLSAAVEYNSEQLLLSLMSKCNNLKANGKIALRNAIKKNYKNLETILTDNGVIDDYDAQFRNYCKKIVENDYLHVFRNGVVSSENEVYENGWTSLHYAVQKSNSKIMEMLLENISDVNVRTNSGDTPVHIAAEIGNLLALEMLNEYKADLNAVNNDGLTPLHIALNAYRSDFVVSLLRLGADFKTAVNISNSEDYTPLHICAENDEPNLVEILLKNGADANKAATRDIVPLHLAAIEGHVNVIDVLIKYEVDLNVKDVKGRSALKFSLLNTQYEVALKLVNAGAKCDIFAHILDDSGYEILFNLLEKSQFELFKLFVKEIHNVHRKNVTRDTLLHRAVLFENVEAIDYLLNVGTYSEELNGNSETVLQYAVKEKKSIEVIKCLVDNKCDVNARDLNGENLISKCLLNDQINEFELFLKNKIQITNENVFQTIRLNKLEFMRILIEYVNINVIYDENGYTPLIFAAKGGHHNIVDLLLEQGADVNIKNNVTHYNVLHEIIEVLEDPDVFFNIFSKLKHYLSDLNIKYPNGDTPLYRAISLNRITAASLLIQYGVCVNEASLRFGDECFALNLAIEKEIEPIIYLLIISGAILPKEWHVSCPPLSYLSRITIRNCLFPSRIRDFENSFNIPVKMKKFLLMQDNCFSNKCDNNYEYLLKNIIINKIKCERDTNL